MVNFLKNISSIWKFFWIVCGLYIGMFLVDPILIQDSVEKFLFLLQQIAGSVVLVFVFMYLFNIFITEKLIKKHLQRKIGFKQYLIVALVGILSTGPIYLWFAHLSRMKGQGMDNGLVSLFLYNRAIKLPLIPLMVEYFSLQITLIITLLIFLFSFINALIIHYFLPPLSHENCNCVYD